MPSMAPSPCLKDRNGTFQVTQLINFEKQFVRILGGQSNKPFKSILSCTTLKREKREAKNPLTKCYLTSPQFFVFLSARRATSTGREIDGGNRWKREEEDD